MPDMTSYLAGRTLILVSNREPYEHVPGPSQGPYGEPGVTVRRPPGGLVSALDPTMRCTRGTWVACRKSNPPEAAGEPSG